MKEQKKHFAHNGDVQAIETNLPKGARPVAQKPLAYGEKSGHIHVVTGDVQLFEVADGTLFAAVGNDGATMQHVHQSLFRGDYTTKESLSKADHNPTPLAPNKVYKIGIHKKYNPFQKTWERVID